MSDEVHRLSRALRTTVIANRAMLRASSEAAIGPEFCRIAVEEGGYRLAWVGYAHNDAAKTVVCVAQFGFDDGYLEQARLTWAENSERGGGPTGLAIRTGRPQVSQHIATDPRLAPWRDQAVRHGFGSSVALPLRDGATTFGALNLYAAESHSFDAAELDLLELLAADLGHAILCARGERKLSRLQEASERSRQLALAGQAAARLAHDINNCLAVVLPTLDVLARSVPPERQGLMVDARSALDRATALIRQLLHIGRARTGRSIATAPDEALVEIAPVLRRALGDDVTLELLLDTSGQHTQIDSLEFDRIVTNLVLNAKDAIVGTGAVVIATRRVELSYPMQAGHAGAAPGSYVAVSVRDTGTGISPEARAHLFEPFFTTKGERGTGLGLASVYALVHEIGGHVHVESELGQGAVFEVLLPSASAPAGSGSGSGMVVAPDHGPRQTRVIW